MEENKIINAENNIEISDTVQNLEETTQQSESQGVVTTNQTGISRRRRILEGRVVSNKPDKTIIVRVERYVQHPLYKKYYKRSKKFMAHDEKNECQVGDLVRIIEWRPLSRRKRWMLKEIVERAK